MSALVSPREARSTSWVPAPGECAGVIEPAIAGAPRPALGRAARGSEPPPVAPSPHIRAGERVRGVGGDLGGVAQCSDRLHLIDDSDQGVAVVGDAGVGVIA